MNMSRVRSTWNDQEIAKRASVVKTADPYLMNQDHVKVQPPADKYVTGDPSSFGEDVHPNDWSVEYAGGQTKRNEIGQPAFRPETFNHPEKTAADQGLLIKKADLATTTARLMLGSKATEAAVEDQAFGLMYLPDAALIATHARLAGEQAQDQDQAKQAQDQGQQAQSQQDQGQQQAKQGNDQGQQAQGQDQAKQAQQDQGQQGQQAQQDQAKQAHSQLQAAMQSGDMNAVQAAVQAMVQAQVGQQIQANQQAQQDQAKQAQQAQQDQGQQQAKQAQQAQQMEAALQAMVQQAVQQAMGQQQPMVAVQPGGGQMMSAMDQQAQQAAMQQQAQQAAAFAQQAQQAVMNAQQAQQGQMQQQAAQYAQQAFTYAQQAQQAAQQAGSHPMAQQALQQAQQAYMMAQQCMGQQQAPVANDSQLLDQMLGAPAPAADMMGDIQLEPSSMDVGEVVLSSEDDVLKGLFANQQEVQDAQQAQQQGQKQAAAHTMRTASNRTIGTRPTGGVPKIGGVGGTPAPAPTGGDIGKLSALWSSAPDVSEAFGIPRNS